MISICVIPARYASSRLPGKPLALIAGKPMVQWVYERALQAQMISRVLVATDHELIQRVVESFGGEVILTSPELASGTDRVAAVIKDLKADIILNLQGDEPFISPELLDQMVKPFGDLSIDMATPVKKIDKAAELVDPNLVRVVRDKYNYALYFTRAVIPHVRDEEEGNWLKSHEFFKHIGIYAYRKDFLLKLTQLPVSTLEKAEKLEQLRVLENGYRIYTVETCYDSISVDTEEDLKRVNQLLVNGKLNVELI